jgi:hypothetical protein
MYQARLTEVRTQLADLVQPVDVLCKRDSPHVSLPSRARLSAQMYTIAWSGPFTQADVAVTQNAWGLYFFRGKCKRQRFSNLQYCGITQQYYHDRFRKHRILPKIRRDLEIWLGQPVSPQRVSWSQLIQAEHMIIHALQPPCNTRCRITEPPPTTIISQWYNRYGQRQVYPHNDFPSVMLWDGEIWQKGDLESWT